MNVPPQAAWLPGGRLHLQHGPIDLVAKAEGDDAPGAYAALTRRFATILAELCDELPLLRQPAGPVPTGPVARRMHAAVLPFAAGRFITPMAAVAGAVAEEALDALRAAGPLRRAWVNNGGDIALHLAAGEHIRLGLVDRPDRPGLFGTATLSPGLGGVATSGWRGRSLSLGIADAVTVLAATAAQADAAATVIANAVDLPGRPGIRRIPAHDVQTDSDLRGRLVTRDVPPLTAEEAEAALDAGAAVAQAVLHAGLAAAVALHCSGRTRVLSGPAGRRDSLVELEGAAHAPA